MGPTLSGKSFHRKFNDTVEGMATDIKDAVRTVDAAAVMGLLPDRPRLLALGEPTHGEDALLRLRNELFRQFVEQEGYRTIAIESDCLMGLVVDDYVTSGTGTLDEAVERGFSHAWGSLAANRELVRWMRAHNEGRPASERVRFAGFDGPLEISGAASPRQALTSLHGYLSAGVDADLLPCTAETLDRLLGADGRWTDPAAMTDPARSVGRSAEAGRLRLLADELVALLDAQTPHLITATRRDDWDRARLYGRTATGLLRYHYGMADTSPARMARLCASRDMMMAHNLLAVAARGPALVHAHNSHLQREKSTMQMWRGRWSGGAPAPWSAPNSARSTPSWRQPSARSGTRGWTRRRRTPSKESCTRFRMTAASSTPPAGHRTRRHTARAPRVPLVRLRAVRPGPSGEQRRPRVRQGRAAEVGPLFRIVPGRTGVDSRPLLSGLDCGHRRA
ncbi:hypothetical protein GCM10020254_07760 [Streptomyces goshikiensis]